LRSLGLAGAEKLLVAGNLSDDVLLLDAASGVIEKRFDLSESDAVPSTYPIALAVSKDGARAFVALWNASEIVELGSSQRNGGASSLAQALQSDGSGHAPLRSGVHPDGKTLYVALANRDAVAAVNVAGGQFSVKGYFDTRLPGQSYFGAEPVALAVNADGSRLYVANAISDAVAVIDTAEADARRPRSRAWSSRPASSPPNGCRCRWRFFPRPPAGALRCHRERQGNRAPTTFRSDRRRRRRKQRKPHRATTYIATCSMARWRRSMQPRSSGESAAMDRDGGSGVEPHEGCRREDRLCRRSEPHQARDLHHQGEPHLRSGLRRPEPTASRWATAIPA
jgi:hypothetical protein